VYEAIVEACEMGDQEGALKISAEHSLKVSGRRRKV
jgi:DNA-binding FadR family transcriptional regulator